MPLFDRFGVEPEIENALKSRVSLPSGGSIVIHQTEALVAIDVNTGRFVGKEDLEETVFAINWRPCPRWRGRSGSGTSGACSSSTSSTWRSPSTGARSSSASRRSSPRDRARTRILQISEFGLMEITRQRSRGNLERVLTRACPDCSGSGRVRSDLTVALDLRRALLAPPDLFTAGETVRVRVRPGVARVLSRRTRRSCPTWRSGWESPSSWFRTRRWPRAGYMME